MKEDVDEKIEINENDRNQQKKIILNVSYLI